MLIIENEKKILNVKKEIKWVKGGLKFHNLIIIMVLMNIVIDRIITHTAIKYVNNILIVFEKTPIYCPNMSFR